MNEIQHGGAMRLDKKPGGWLGAIAVGVGALVVWQQFTDPQAGAMAATSVEQRQFESRVAQVRASYREDRPAFEAGLEELISVGNWNEYFSQLNALATFDPASASLWRRRGSLARALAKLEALRSSNIEARLPVYRELDRLEPGTKWAALSRQAEDSVSRQRIKAASDEARRMRSQGVEIGMTKERVLKSSWGRPRLINSTTTAKGTRQQWVYDGGYLYFNEQGVLTTIQN